MYVSIFIPLFFLAAVIWRTLLSPLSVPQWILIATAMASYLAAGIFVIQLRKFQAGTVAFWVASFLVVASAGLLNGGMRAPGVAFIITFPVIATGLSGKRAGKAVTLAAVASLGMIYIFQEAGWARPFQFTDPGVHSRVLIAIYSVLTFLSYALASSYEASRFHGEKRLVELSRLADLRALASGVSHEINNPTTAITLTLDLLQKKIANEQVTAEDTLVALEATRSLLARITRITHLLNIYSQDETKEGLAQISVTDLIQDVLLLRQDRFAAEGIVLEFTPPKEDFRVLCRRGELFRVLVSLINNSYDAVAGQNEKWIRIVTLKVADRAEIMVSDSGKGIPAGLQRHLFSPFFTTKAPGKGVGLHLSLGASILNSQGGRLYYDEGAEHTTFVIRLARA